MLGAAFEPSESFVPRSLVFLFYNDLMISLKDTAVADWDPRAGQRGHPGRAVQM